MNDEAGNKQPLWVITELYYPEETSTGYYLTRTAEIMSEAFDVKAICGQPNYAAKGIRAAKRETRNGVEIFRVGGTRLNKNVIFFKLINMVTLSIAIFFEALFSFRPKDRVLVVTTPPTLPFVAAVAALIRGAHYVLVIHDNYPEILIAAGKIKNGGVLASILNYCNRWLYKHSSKIIVVGRDMEKLIKHKTDGLDIPIVVIQNWAELETVEPTPRAENPLLTELGLKDKFVFLYAGNMGYPNDIETIVECADRLKENAEIHFIFLGTGAKERALRKSVGELELTNVTLLAPKPRGEQTTFLNACDVALVSLVAKMRGVSMPSRTYNILAAGKPMLALTDDESEVAIVIDEDRVGWHVPPGNADRLIAAINEIYKRRGVLHEYGQRARVSALEKYSLSVAARKYIDALTF